MSRSRHAGLLRTLVRGYLHGLYRLRKAAGHGPFGPDGPRIINAPIKPGDNPLKTALYQYHVKQYHEASCSVATVASVLNAARAIQGMAGEPIGQHDLLETVQAGHWKQRMSPAGHSGHRGLPLPLLGQVAQASFDTYAIPYAALETVPMSSRSRSRRQAEAILWQRLEGFETRGDGIIIAHFDQGAFVPVLNIPHISPVGGFDPATGDVIVFDVDPDQSGPYQVGFETFCKGLASNYHHMFTPFGYGSGGYVYVTLR